MRRIVMLIDDLKKDLHDLKISRDLLNAQMHEMESLAHQINSFWQSDATDRFLDEYQTIYNEIRTSISKLDKTIAFLEKQIALWKRIDIFD